MELDFFHTKSRQPLEGSTTITNCLAEYLFPDAQFSLGMVYKKGTLPEDLRPYEGKSLQFSSGERMYFADEAVGEALYPVPSDRSAYGSLPFTPCQSVQEITARVLIIDDETGLNGGLFDEKRAMKCVGDCFGRISTTLCEDLTGQKRRPFQFRMGIKPQAQCEVFRIAKGTLAACNLDAVIPDTPIEICSNEEGKPQVIRGFDIILPTSSFKGRKGEDAIAPGAYQLTMGIGVKTLAQYRQHSLGTQVLVNYPKAVKAEIIPRLERQASLLTEAQRDIRTLARYYVEVYEKRFRFLEKLEAEEDSLNGDLSSALDAMIDEAFGDEKEKAKKDLFLYRILKQDLAHHCQLLEHPQVVRELRQFVRKQWLDLATGRAIKFQSGLAQPSLNLAEDEIWIPGLSSELGSRSSENKHLDAKDRAKGEQCESSLTPNSNEVIVSRSPLLNSNGVIVLKNKPIPEAMNQEGVVYIHPKTAAKCLQADFDGDFLFFAPAEDYPTFSEEVQEALLPHLYVLDSKIH